MKTVARCKNGHELTPENSREGKRGRQCLECKRLYKARYKIRERELRRAESASRTHCDQGHEFTAENTILLKRGNGRRCRACSIAIGVKAGTSSGLSRRKARQARTHCNNGHELTPENRYEKKSGYVACRTCRASKLAKQGEARRAKFQSRSHCANGHEWTPENTKILRGGSWQCRACRAAQLAKSRDKSTEKSLSRTRCKNGHEWTPENTRIIKKTGHRDCRECLKARNRANLAKRYGMSGLELQSMLAAQKHKCANRRCGAPIDMSTKQIDHDHATGHVRGLLCSGCNRALGQLEDSPDRCLGLYHYLMLHAPKLPMDGLGPRGEAQEKAS